MNDQQPDKGSPIILPPSDTAASQEENRSFQQKLKAGIPVVRQRVAAGSRNAYVKTKAGWQKADSWLLDRGDKVRAKTRSLLRNVRVNTGTGFRKLRVNTGEGLKRIRLRSQEAGQTFRVKSRTSAEERKNNQSMKAASRVYKPYKYRGLYSRVKRHGRQKVYRLKGYTTVARVDRKRRRERLRHQRNQLLITAIIVIGLITLFLWLDPVPKIVSVLEDIGFLD